MDELEEQGAEEEKSATTVADVETNLRDMNLSSTTKERPSVPTGNFNAGYHISATETNSKLDPSKASSETPTIRCEPYTHRLDTYAHIDVVFIFNWKEGETPKSSRITITLTWKICKNLAVVPVSTDCEISKQTPTHRCEYHPTAMQITVVYLGTDSHPVNDLDCDMFGPWSKTVTELRSWIAYGGKMSLAFETGANIQEIITQVQEAWEKEKRLSDTPTEIIPPNQASNNARSVDLSSEKLRGFEFKPGRTGDKHELHCARFFRLFDDDEMVFLLMIVSTTRHDVLDIEDGGNIAFRIHALNADHLRDCDWLSQRITVAKDPDPRFVIRHPCDKAANAWLNNLPNLKERHLQEVEPLPTRGRHYYYRRLSPDASQGCNGGGLFGYMRSSHSFNNMISFISRDCFFGSMRSFICEFRSPAATSKRLRDWRWFDI